MVCDGPGEGDEARGGGEKGCSAEGEDDGVVICESFRSHDRVVVRQFLGREEECYICHGDQHTMRSARVGGAALPNLGAEIIDECVDHWAVQLRNPWRALAL